MSKSCNLDVTKTLWGINETTTNKYVILTNMGDLIHLLKVKYTFSLNEK